MFKKLSIFFLSFTGTIDKQPLLRITYDAIELFSVIARIFSFTDGFKKLIKAKNL